jgi:hypothetical protein
MTARGTRVLIVDDDADLAESHDLDSDPQSREDVLQSLDSARLVQLLQV